MFRATAKGSHASDATPLTPSPSANRRGRSARSATPLKPRSLKRVAATRNARSVTVMCTHPPSRCAPPVTRPNRRLHLRDIGRARTATSPTTVASKRLRHPAQPATHAKERRSTDTFKEDARRVTARTARTFPDVLLVPHPHRPARPATLRLRSQGCTRARWPSRPRMLRVRPATRRTARHVRIERRVRGATSRARHTSPPQKNAMVAISSASREGARVGAPHDLN
jgi:hypothetical protein